MSASPVINCLRRKRAEISGMIRDLESRAHAVRRDLAHIDATLKMFDPGAPRRTIKPLRPYRPRNRMRESPCASSSRSSSKTRTPVSLSPSPRPHRYRRCSISRIYPRSPESEAVASGRLAPQN